MNEESRELSPQLKKLSDAGLPVETFSKAMQEQVSKLDEAEIEALTRIKKKLNSGLSGNLRERAGNVGGFVW